MAERTKIRFLQDYPPYQTGDVVDINETGLGSGVATTLISVRRAEWVEPKSKAVKGRNVRNKAMSAAGGE